MLLAALCLASQSLFALGDFGGSSLDSADLGVGVPGPAIPARLFVNDPSEYARIIGLKANGDAFYRNIDVFKGFDDATGLPKKAILPLVFNPASGKYSPDYYSSLTLGDGTFFFSSPAQQDALTQYFQLVQGAGILSRGIGMATGSGAYAPIETLGVRLPQIMTTATPPVTGSPLMLMEGTLTSRIQIQYQAFYNQGWLRNVAAFNAGKIAIPVNMSWRTILGQRTDVYARNRLLDYLLSAGIAEGRGAEILVNRRLSDPLGSGLYRIPDVYLPGSFILDGTIGFKSINSPQVIDFMNFGGVPVDLVRPTVGPGF